MSDSLQPDLKALSGRFPFDRTRLLLDLCFKPSLLTRLHPQRPGLSPSLDQLTLSSAYVLHFLTGLAYSLDHTQSHGLLFILQFQGNALTRRQTLIALESLYELVLQLEQLRRSQPPPSAIDGSDEDKDRFASWQQAYDAKVEEAWKGVMVDLPVEIRWEQSKSIRGLR